MSRLTCKDKSPNIKVNKKETLYLAPHLRSLGAHASDSSEQGNPRLRLWGPTLQVRSDYNCDMAALSSMPATATLALSAVSVRPR